MPEKRNQLPSSFFSDGRGRNDGAGTHPAAEPVRVQRHPRPCRSRPRGKQYETCLTKGVVDPRTKQRVSHFATRLPSQGIKNCFPTCFQAPPHKDRRPQHGRGWCQLAGGHGQHGRIKEGSGGDGALAEGRYPRRHAERGRTRRKGTRFGLFFNYPKKPSVT